MSKSIAGAKNTGHFADKYVAKSKLSAAAVAILARVLAEAGATSITSAQRPRETWLFHTALSLSSWVKEVSTSRSVRVDSVRGVTNPLAASVMTT